MNRSRIKSTSIVISAQAGISKFLSRHTGAGRYLQTMLPYIEKIPDQAHLYRHTGVGRYLQTILPYIEKFPDQVRDDVGFI